MATRSTPGRWGGVTRLLHWGMALMIAGQVALGWYMTDLPRGVPKLKLYALHKSFGLTLLALAVLRLLWRLAERRPEPPSMPAWQARAATLTHVVLYALLLAIPLSGWLFNSVAGFPLQWFQLVNLPALAASNPALKDVARELHENGVTILLVVLALHAGGALKHHFWDRNRTLASMTPGLRPPAAKTPQ
jgi:cytochrome b561